MYVPNYIPEPVEIANNVTMRPFGERMGFLRRVLALHFGSLGVLALLTALHGPHPSLIVASILVGVCLMTLSVLRIETRGTRADTVLSVALLPFLLVGLSFLVRVAIEREIMIWAMPIGPACALIYALACGRDYSFVGQWFLSIIASNVAIAVIVTFTSLSTGQAWQAILLNSLYLTYVVYDSASLMARRRIGEELAAVADLYRDILNFFGYAIRCIRHWRKHRIWTAR